MTSNNLYKFFVFFYLVLFGEQANSSTLEDMPCSIKYKIISNISPNDFISLIYTCKKLHTFGRSIVKERIFKPKSRNISEQELRVASYKNTLFTKVKIGNIYISPELIKDISSNTSLNFLELNNINRDIHTLDISRLSNSFMESLSGGIKNNTSLRTLILEQNKIRKKSFFYLSEVFKSSTVVITHLEIFLCGLSDNGVKILSKALRRNKCLETLKIYNNKITDSGAASVAKLLACNDTLKLLNLYCNNITDVGFLKIILSLTKNTSLMDLYIGHNQIGNKGAKYLSKNLEKISLKTLDLSRNKISNEGIKHLISSLKKKISLTMIRLEENKLDITSMNALKEVSKSNPTLTLIYEMTY